MTEVGARRCFARQSIGCVSDAFDYNRATDQIVRPDGNCSLAKLRLDNGDRYWPVRDCTTWPRQGSGPRDKEEGRRAPGAFGWRTRGPPAIRLSGLRRKT